MSSKLGLGDLPELSDFGLFTTVLELMGLLYLTPASHWGTQICDHSQPRIGGERGGYSIEAVARDRKWSICQNGRNRRVTQLSSAVTVFLYATGRSASDSRSERPSATHPTRRVLQYCSNFSYILFLLIFHCLSRLSPFLFLLLFLFSFVLQTTTINA